MPPPQPMRLAISLRDLAYKIFTESVEIHGKHHNGVEFIQLPDTPGPEPASFLSQAQPRISFFGISGLQTAFAWLAPMPPTHAGKCNTLSDATCHHDSRVGPNAHGQRAPLVPSSVCRSARRSASTIMTTSSSNETFGSQPSIRLALAASPINRSTSVGR